MSTLLGRRDDPFRKKIELLLLALVYLFIALSVIPGAGSAVISLISIICGHEETIVEYLREICLLLYPIVASISLVLSWFERVNAKHKKAWLIIGIPFALTAAMLAMDCHPFISMYILPSIPLK